MSPEPALTPGYAAILFVHVGAAMVWIGGIVTIQALVGRARRSRQPTNVVVAVAAAEWVGTRVLLPASLVVIGAGLALVAAGPHTLAQPWVLAGLVGFAVSVVVGTLLGSQGRQFTRLVQSYGAADDRVSRRVERIVLVSRFELVALGMVVLVMVVKPG